MDRTLQIIQAEGAKAGLVFNPAQPLDVLEWVIDKVDPGVDRMSANPGFGGQSFIDSALRKIEKPRAGHRRVRPRHPPRGRWRNGKVDNIRQAADAGVDTFVAGSAIFGQKDYAHAIAQMRAALA